MSALDAIQPGARLEYVGPPRDIYTNVKSHPSYYQDYAVAEVKQNRWLDWVVPDAKFCRVICVERERPEVRCTGWRYISLKDWRVLPT